MNDEIRHHGADDADLPAGMKVGEYEIVEKIGEGGFGTVFRAEHPLIGKEAAVKVLNRKYSSDPEMVSRFVSEARAVNQIRHRYIIDIFSFGQLEDGRSYYVMEFLAGRPLDQHLDSFGPMSLSAALPILKSLAHALDSAHSSGIAHRDLKPENIFLVDDEATGCYPKLLDFGIAKLLTDKSAAHKTRTGAPMGTPYYMSPEQARGKDVDQRTDVYAFGCVVYKMLTNEVPFEGEDYMEILWQQISEEATPASSRVTGLSTAVDDVLSWMMAKDVDERPGSLVLAVSELEKAAGDPSRMLDRKVTKSSTATTRSAAPQSSAQSSDAVGMLPTMAGPEGADGVTELDASSAEVAAATAHKSTARPTVKVGAPKRVPVLLGLVAMAGLGALAFVLMSGGNPAREEQDGSKQPRALQSKPKAAPRAAPEPAPALPVTPPDAAPQLSSNITIQITGPPKGTEVYGPAGLLGVAPGQVQLPRSDETVQLSFRADGFKAASLEVDASDHGAIEVELIARSAGAQGKSTKAKRGAKGKGAKDNADKAGKANKSGKGGRDAIEDPFR